MKLNKNISKIDVTIISLLLVVEVFAADIYIIGDSTVRNNDPYTGWGQVFQYYFNSDSIEVHNHAIAGRSTKSFVNEGRWETVRNALQPGDYVFVQFGINDGDYTNDARYAPPWTLYSDYLKQFVEESRAKGATCILMTPARKNNWSGSAMGNGQRGDYPAATVAMADSLSTPLINLHDQTKVVLDPYGKSFADNFVYHSDGTHFIWMGAVEVASLIVEEVKKLSQFPEMVTLASDLKPQHDFTISTNMPEVALMNHSATYPDKLPVIVKVIPDTYYELIEWQDGAGNMKSTENEFDFTMVNEPVTFHAVIAALADTVIIQEDEKGFCSVDGVVDATNTGYTGTGYAQTEAIAGSGIDYEVSIGLADTYKLEWRYANGSTDRMANLLINGSQEITDISFPGTGGWSEWSTVSVELVLSSGPKSIRLEAAGGDGLAHIDYFTISGAVVEPVGCGSQEIIDGAVYKIVNKGSGKVLEVAGASMEQNATIQQNTNTDGTHQQWQLDKVDGDYFAFTAMHSGLVMNVFANSPLNRANVVQWASGGTDNQKWSVIDEGGGWFKVAAKHSSKCLDVADGSTADGANVQQWEDTGTDAQRWQFVLINDPSAISDSENNNIPGSITLEQNYPNPFNPNTTIKYSVGSFGMGQPVSVQLSIYNALGQKMATLFDGQQTAGNYSVTWNATGFSSGVYLYHLQVGEASYTRKMLLLQ
jgi:lysophospholipase L1-like esterase